MKTISYLLLLNIFICFSTIEAIDISECTTWAYLDDPLDFSSSASIGPLSWFFPVADRSSWCMNLTVESVVGLTMAVSFSQPEASAIGYLTDQSFTLNSGMSHFVPLNAYSNDQPHDFTIRIAPGYSSGLNMTIYFRFDLAGILLFILLLFILLIFFYLLFFFI